MSLFPLRILGAFPNLETHKGILEEFAELGAGSVCVLDSGLVGRIRELMAAFPNLSFSSPAEIAASQLVLSNLPSAPIADSKQVAEFVRSALRSSNCLGPLEPVRDLPGIQRRLHSTLSELRQWRIAPEQLRRIDSRLDSVSIEKFAALADLEDLVSRSMSESHLETEEKKLERALESDLVQSQNISRILIFSGGYISPLIVDWIKCCQENGSILWVVTPYCSRLPISWTGSQKLSEACNSPIEEVGTLPGLVAEFSQLKGMSESSVKVSIESAADELAECEWALRRVLADLNSGLRHSQIGIFVRDLSSYAPLLSAVGERLNVPLRLSIKVELLTSQLAIWILSLLHSLDSKSLRQLVQVTASTYSTLSNEECAVVKGIIYDSMRVRGGEWNRLSDQALGLPNWVQAVLEWRRRSHDQPCSRKEWISRFHDLLQIDPIIEFSKHQESDRTRDSIALEEMRQSYARHVFADLDSDLLSFSEFVRDIEQVWELATIDVGSHGAGIDVVESPLELLGKHSIHALGLLEGMFPRRRSEDPILSDWERSILVDSSLPNSMLSSHSIAAKESELFLTLLGAPKHRLCLSYPTTNEDRDNVPAYYLSQLSDALGARIEKSHHLQGVWAPEAEKCISEADHRLSRAVDSPMVPFRAEVVEDETSLAALRTERGARYSIFDLRIAAGCAFRFAAQRKLQLDPKSEEVRLRRLPGVESLPKFENLETAERELTTAWNQYVEEIESETTPETIALASAAAKRSVKDVVDSEFLSRKLWPKEDGKTELSVEFESDSLCGEIKLDANEKLRLTGRIPAVSKMGPYRVAQVFRARKALFSPPDKWEDEEKLEVGLYFAALGNSLPGAAIEFCADDGDRVLVCSELIPGSQPKSQPKDGLMVVSANAKETKLLAKAGEIVRKAVATSRNHSMEASPSEQCTFCDFGELCRRSREFGEQSDLMEENE